MAESSKEYFCLEEIAKVKNLISNTVSVLPEIRLNYEGNKDKNKKEATKNLHDLQICVRSLLENFPCLIQQLNEFGDMELKDTAVRFYKVLSGYDYLGVLDYSPLCNALRIFTEQLPKKDDDINTAGLARMANRAKMGYFPTDLMHVDIIKNSLVFPNEKINVIDPCCGEGLAVERLTKDIEADTYGTEIDTVRAEEAETRLTKVGFGSFFYSHISNGVFQCLFLNPPYLSTPSENGMRRLEKVFLAESIRLLQIGGVIVYIIPYYRASQDICRMLCENFAKLGVFRFTGKEFERFHQVVFIGKRVKRREAYEQSQKLFDFTEDIERLEKEIAELKQNSNTVDVNALRSELEDIEQKIRLGNLTEEEVFELNSFRATLVGIEAEIKTLESFCDAEKLKDAVNQQMIFKEQIEQSKIKINALKEFVSKRTELMTESLKMPNVTIRLEDVIRTTGEIKNVFKFDYKGRDYNTLSLSEKTLAGVEIAAMVRKICSVDCPICIDNTESIAAFNDAPMPTQTILLRFIKGQPLTVQSRDNLQVVKGAELKKAS